MIKIANNLQRMLNTVSNKTSGYIPPRLGLDPQNFYYPFQRELQQENSLMSRDLNDMTQAVERGYSDMIGPHGIPSLLSRAGQFSADTQTAMPQLAQDYSNRLNMQTQALNQLGAIGNNALNYVEANIPEAQRHARDMVTAGLGALTDITPALRAQQQAQAQVGKRLGSRIMNIGQSLLNQPLGQTSQDQQLRLKAILDQLERIQSRTPSVPPAVDMDVSTFMNTAKPSAVDTIRGL